MKKTNFTFYSKLTRPLTLVFGLMLLSWGVSNAQCSLGCTYSIQVSLDNEDCEATITPADLLTDSTTCPNGVFVVELRYNDLLLPNSPTITRDYVGKKIEAKVRDTISGNSCWGYITVEDKLAPVIECEPPGPLFCYESRDFAPEVVENCGLYTLQVTDSIVVTNTCDGTFSDEVLKRVTKTYKAVDASGNESEECTISYDVLRLPNLSQTYIKRPMNFLYPDDNLLCNDTFKLDINKNPHPDVTGYPQLDGKDLKPDEILVCNLLVDYEDDVVKSVQCVTKILRTWTILEWSCGNTRTRSILQMIEIADTNKPTITGAKDITVSTTPHHCDAMATIPPVIVADSCTATADITVTISGGTPLIVGNGGVTSLPVGDNVLTYTATDACGNTTTAEITVTVKDLTPPVAVCDQNTTVSVTTDGLAWVPATVFDDGSYDECALDRLVVRRMDPTTCGECERPNFDGFHYLGKNDGKYYYLSSWPSNFHVAKKYTHSLGGQLAITNTQAKAEWLHDKVTPYLIDNEMYFIGLERVGNTPEFKWHDGTVLSYTNWGVNQPDDFKGNEDAVEVRANGKWNDVMIHDVNKYVLEISDPCGFSEYVKFCCADVGTDHMVVLRAIDQSGNYNECMVNAEIQDKLPPTIVCPIDLSINCDAYYPTGDLVADFGNYTFYDNCESPTILDTIIEENVNQCNVGYLRRSITATDKGGRSATCIQRIDIYGRSYDFGQLDFPKDVTINTCEDPTSDQFHPDNTGRPVFVGDNQCNLLGADYEDKVYTFNNPNGEACFKIIRTWSFIDWCEYNGYTHTVYTRDQVIKVHDDTKPVITSSCERKSTCTYDASCKDGFIELTATATDVCTDILDYFWKIDVGNNGTFEGGFYKNQPLSGNGKANMINASGVYPVGSHRIQYTFADKCGNVTTCDQLFDIVNCKAPTPYCLNGLAVDLMPVTDQTGEVVDGMVALWASDFDAGSFHTCPEYKVYVSFSENILDTGRVFTCADLGRADVMIWASVITPMGDTLQSFCNTFVDVQDNMGACDGELRVGVFGNLHTSDDRDLLGAEVTLEGIEAVLVNSDVEGNYTFGQMPTGGNYMVVPSKNDDHMNGISTLDLVLMQRHILEIETFVSPYNFIAADINKDNKITASDLVELRKLILGVTNEFTNNDSWRFIDDNVQFVNGTNPFDVAFSEEYEINNLDSDMEINFTSVKVGDVNGNVKTNIRDTNSEPRSANTLSLMTKNVEYGAGDNVTLNLSSEQLVDLAGLQFTLNFDQSTLTFEGVNSKGIQIDQSNLGLVHLEDGMITFSWNEINAAKVNELFEINFTATGNGSVGNSINISSDVTVAEAYNSSFEVMDVEFRTIEDKSSLVLYQNVPNPFNENTTISFNMPTKGQASISILDVTGKLIYANTNTYNQGMNSLTFNKTQHNLSGVMYYQLTVNDETLVKKMVVIE